MEIKLHKNCKVSKTGDFTKLIPYKIFRCSIQLSYNKAIIGEIDLLV